MTMDRVVMIIKKNTRQCLLLVTLIFIMPAGLAQGGYYSIPSITITKLDDDNIFLTPAGEKHDIVTRITPAIEFGYESESLSWSGDYTVDAERYNRNSVLDNNTMRQSAGLSFEFTPNALTQFNLDGNYTETQTPGDLNLVTGLQRGRFFAKRSYINPVLIYQLYESSFVSLDYSLRADKLAGGISGDRHQAVIDYRTMLNEKSELTAGYTFRRYTSENEQNDETSHLPWIGIDHKFTPKTSVDARVGPRQADGDINPSISLSLLHQYVNGEIEFNYIRDETNLIGESGRRETETVGISFYHQLGQKLELEVSPRYGTVTRRGVDADIYRFTIDAGYRINRNIEISAAWNYSSQDEFFSSNTEQTIERNVFLIGINYSTSFPRSKSINR